jgi:hypothetical protein
MAKVVMDIAEMRDFFQRMKEAGGDKFKNSAAEWLEGLGIEFLRIVEDEIIRRQVVDTRLLLHSFTRGAPGNIFETTDGGLTIEVGTNIPYANYVNDGHWTNSKGVSSRFVPGYWQGDRFIYDPGANTGMTLRQKWVEGKHYFESAVRIFERMWPDLLEAKLQKWIDEYFGS